MIISNLEVTLPEELEQAVQAEVLNGRFASPSEFFTVAVYKLAQQMERDGKATPEVRAVLARPLEEYLTGLRQALA